MAGPGEIDLSLEVSRSVIARFLIAAVGFVGTIVFAQVLGPTDFGGNYLLFA